MNMISGLDRNYSTGIRSGLSSDETNDKTDNNETKETFANLLKRACPRCNRGLMERTKGDKDRCPKCGYEKVMQ